TQLIVQCAYGKREGIATINEFDDAALERVVRRAEDLAKLAPENPEFMPAIEKQTYKPSPTFSPSTAAITPEYRAQVAADSIAPCKAEKLIAAGFLEDGQSFVAFANSKGNFGYPRATNFNYTCTVRTEDGRGSGWVGRNVKDADAFKADSDIRTAMRKATESAEAKALEPGKYTVILEPAAAAGLISFMMRFFDARQADEGRSFLSKKGGGNKLGEQVYDPRVNISADPWDPSAPVLPWDQEGLPREKMAIVENGKVAALQYSRYWAKKQGKRAVGVPGNLLVAGGDKSTAQLVASTQKGILVTRTWYIRMVDPQTVLLTGLTRDGTFYIENGQIKHPVKNFRFNESPVIMLNNIEELGKPVRVAGDESSFVMMIPPMKLRDFTFTSLSDAV
ncbi:MAG TPA: TldD/PmbA family protein, partial [Lysobacter sp.]|nr:TldD/PmbA family protein [Lysobacter sp.]